MPKDMADVLREAIRKSGTSALQLSKETGVSQPSITEFLRGADMRLATAQKLADYFGLPP
jgi:transcriptional regulator with XRE-family HTH domain